MSGTTIDSRRPSRSRATVATARMPAPGLTIVGSPRRPPSTARTATRHPNASQEHGVPFVVGAGIVIASLVFGLLVPWARGPVRGLPGGAWRWTVSG